MIQTWAALIANALARRLTFHNPFVVYFSFFLNSEKTGAGDTPPLQKTQSDLRKMYNCTQAAKYINQTAKDIKRFKQKGVAPNKYKYCGFLSYFAYFVCKRGPSLFRNKYLLGYPIVMGIIHRGVSCVKTMSFCDWIWESQMKLQSLAIVRKMI